MKIVPFLMFDGKAADAMSFYVGLFQDGKILTVSRYGKGEPGAEGTIKQAIFSLAGQQLMCIDSAVEHNFTFTPAMSLYVECDTDRQITELAANLSENGAMMMPLDGYGFSQKFTWLTDKYGVSWQLNLPHPS